MVGLSRKRVFPKAKGDSITGQDRAQKHCDFRFSQIEKKSKVAVLQLNSMYDLLERLLSQTAPIHATFAESDIRRDRSVLLTDEQSSAEELLIVLKELKTATTIVCDQKLPQSA